MTETTAPPHGEEPQDDPAAELIRQANDELESASTSRFDLPISVLIRQRDDALRDMLAARAEVSAQLAQLRAEQDAFVRDLMLEHEEKLAVTRRQTQHEIDALRQQLLAPKPTPRPTSPGMGAVLPKAAPPVPTTTELVLREQLENAEKQIASLRDESDALREELDVAAIAYDDLRQEMWASVVEARDEATALRTELAELKLLLDDQRVAADATADQLQQELRGLHVELDKARGELTLARAQPTVRPGTGVKALEEAREESDRAQNELAALRLALIDAKRNLSRRSQELVAVKAELRQTRRPPGRRDMPENFGEASPAAAHTPAFQRFLARSERRGLGSYSTAGAVDVVPSARAPADDRANRPTDRPPSSRAGAKER